MLIDFKCANFKSFRDEAHLTLEAVKAFKEYDEENSFVMSAGTLLKSAAIYGPNAGGKSNFVQAIAFMVDFIRHSAGDHQQGDPIAVDSYRLDTKTAMAPSYFQVTLLDGSDKFRYGFEVDKETVRSEWLYVTDLSRKGTRPRVLFLREDNGIDVKSKPGGISDAKALVQRTRPNALFLSVAAMWNEPIAQRLMTLIGKIRILRGDKGFFYRDVSLEMLSQPKKQSTLIEVIKLADLCIENISAEEKELSLTDFKKLHLPTEVLNKLSKEDLILRSVKTEHAVYTDDTKVGSVSFDLEKDESAGIIKYFHMMGPIIDTMANGYTVFIDELEAMLHPLLTKMIVKLFHTPQINTKNAQVVFCTHDTGLLSHGGLRRDQIWFVEKSKKGASTLYPLSDFKKVRKDTSLEDGYIKGRFGAIPFPGGTDILARLMRDA